MQLLQLLQQLSPLKPAHLREIQSSRWWRRCAPGHDFLTTFLWCAWGKWFIELILHRSFILRDSFIILLHHHSFIPSSFLHGFLHPSSFIIFHDSLISFLSSHAFRALPRPYHKRLLALAGQCDLVPANDCHLPWGFHCPVYRCLQGEKRCRSKTLRTARRDSNKIIIHLNKKENKNLHLVGFCPLSFSSAPSLQPAAICSGWNPSLHISCASHYTTASNCLGHMRLFPDHDLESVRNCSHCSLVLRCVKFLYGFDNILYSIDVLGSKYLKINKLLKRSDANVTFSLTAALVSLGHQASFL